MNIDTESLVRRWIAVFHEPPVLIDPDLMRAVLADVEPRAPGPAAAADAHGRPTNDAADLTLMRVNTPGLAA